MRLKQEIINGIFAIKDLSNSLESFNTFNPFNLVIYKVNEIITEERRASEILSAQKSSFIKRIIKNTSNIACVNDTITG